MRGLGNSNYYGHNHKYNRNRAYSRRVNKKRLFIFILILAIGLIVLFACVGESKKNEKIQQLTEYGLTMFEQEVLSPQIDEMRGEGLADLTAQIIEDKYPTFNSDENTLILQYNSTYYSNDIDQYANVECDSNEAMQLYNMFSSMNSIKDKYFYDKDESIEYRFEMEGVGTVIIKMGGVLDQHENYKRHLVIHSNNNVFDLAKDDDGYASLQLNDSDFLYFKTGRSSSSGSGSSGKTNKCAQCGKPIYSDETWCDDCLFGSIGGSSYDSDYQKNLEIIADAYGVTPEEVDKKIKAVTGE